MIIFSVDTRQPRRMIIIMPVDNEIYCRFCPRQMDLWDLVGRTPDLGGVQPPSLVAPQIWEPITEIPKEPAKFSVYSSINMVTSVMCCGHKMDRLGVELRS
jgi:hypothetical protein